MNQILLKETPSTPCGCELCGGQLRLIGNEPHPVQDDTDLLTYTCTVCDEFVVTPVKSSANI
jgi:hypothetical protein